MRKRLVQRRGESQPVGQDLTSSKGAGALRLVALRLALGLVFCMGGAGEIPGGARGSMCFWATMASCRRGVGSPWCAKSRMTDRRS